MMILVGTIAVTAVSAQPGYGNGQGKGYGQHGQGPEHFRGHGHGYGPDSCHIQLMVNDVAKEVGLSDKEEAKLLQLHYDHMAEIKNIDVKYKNDCVAARDARIASREKMDKSIKDMLNEGQLAKYDEFMQNRPGPHGKPHQGQGRGCGNCRK
jgi:hypothetical protein